MVEKVSTTRAHFSATVIGCFPVKLLKTQYILSEYGEKLGLDPNHIVGKNVDCINFTYWFNCKSTLQMCQRNKIAIRELIFEGNDELTDEFVSFVLKNKYITKELFVLNITGCNLLSDASLQNFAMIQSLHTLNLSNVSAVNDSYIDLLVGKLKELHSLDVSNCILLTNRSLVSIATKSNKKLVSLKAANIVNFTTPGTNEVLLHCENLEVLDISRCVGITFVGVVVRTFGQLQNVSRALTHLNVSDVSDLSPESLHWICASLPLLNSVNLNNVKNVSDATIQGLLTTCTALTDIHFNNCHCVTNQCVQYVATRMKNIREISLSNISGGLESSTVYRLLHHSDLRVEEPDEFSVNVGHTLSLLKISDTEPVTSSNQTDGHSRKSGNSGLHSGAEKSKPARLTYSEVVNMPHKGSRLTSVDLSCNRTLSDECLTTLSLKTAKNTSDSQSTTTDSGGAFGPDTALRIMNIAHCSFTSYGVALVAKRYTHLEQLNISGSKFVSDSALIAVAHSCTLLRKLFANDCYALTDAAVVAVCRQCKLLSTLHVSWLVNDHSMSSFQLYKQYTDIALRAVLQCGELREVAMCNQIGIKLAAKWFKAHFPNRGNYSIQSVDMRGCTSIALDKIEGILKHCAALNDVWLPEKCFGTDVASARFHARTFRRSVYSKPYSAEDCEAQHSATKQTHMVEISTKKQSIAETLNKRPKPTAPALVGYHILQPVPNKRNLEYRDLFFRRRLLELHSVRKIQMQYRLHRIWVRFRTRVMARRIANTYFIILQRRRRTILLSIFIREHAAKRIQRCFYKNKVQYLYAAKRIQKFVRRYQHQCRLREYHSINRTIVKIQKVVRGMLCRLSERYILAQIYMKLPPFWRDVMKVAPNIATRGQQSISSRPPSPLGDRGSEPNAANSSAGKVANGDSNSSSPTKAENGNKSSNSSLSRPGSRSGSPLEKQQSRRFMKRKIQPYEISELREQASEMLTHILDDVVTNRTLAPKLPFVVPQPFDKAPYVSLSDGRKISFYGHKHSIFSEQYLQETRNDKNFVMTDKSIKELEGRVDTYDSQEALRNKDKGKSKLQLLNEQQSAHKTLPVHSFNVTFWPLTDTPVVNDASTLEHDPSLNNFEVAENKREALFCEICRTRLRIINCTTCLKGYCFFCAFRVHTQKFKRNHVMSMMEPRVIKYKEVTKSLVYHIDIAQGVAHDLGYLVKYMRSSAEVKRIQKERQLLKDYEKMEEARRLAFIKASEESREKHEAATKISLLYRYRKAQRIVFEKRTQKKLEACLFSQDQFLHSVVLMQTVGRMFLVRLWFYKRGVKLSSSSNRKAKKRLAVRGSVKVAKSKLISKADIREKVMRDVRVRSQNNRRDLVADLATKYADLMQVLDANILFWQSEFARIQPYIDKFLAIRDQLHADHKAQSVSAVTLRLSAISATEMDKHEIFLRGLFMKVEAADNRLENFRNMNWWVVQHLRSNYRKKAILKARLEDTLYRLEWVATESTILSRIEFHMFERAARLSKEPEMEAVSAWVKRYCDLGKVHQIGLDSQQETIIKEELSRLQLDHHTAAELDSLVEELHKALSADNQYTAERIYLDNQLKMEVYGSERAITLNEQLILLKNKQKQLSGSVIDALKVGLQQKYNDEDEKNMLDFAFPNDLPDMPIDQMHTIEAVLIEEYSPPHHCKISDFLHIYLVQPWLAEQSVEDVRLEEKISAKELKLGKIQEELKGIQFKIKDSQDRKVAIERRIRECNNEINLHRDYEPSADEEEEPEEERLVRMELLQTLHQEIQGLETEQGLTVKAIETQSKLFEPVMAKIDEIVAEILEIKEDLQRRIQQREKSSKLFFDLEKKISEDLLPLVLTYLHTVDVNLANAQKQVSLCQSFGSEDSVVQDVLDDKITLEERELINIPRDKTKRLLQECQHLIRPRTNSSALDSTRVVIQTQLLYAQTNERFYSELKSVVEAEEQDLLSFKAKRPFYEASLVLFRDHLLQNRRQRALQMNIDHRLKRLVDMRKLRLRSMQDEKEAQMKVEAEMLAEKQRVANRPKPNRLKRVAKTVKTGIRGAQDMIRDLRYKNDINMNEEEQRMARNIREKNKDGMGSRPEAIKAIKFTVGILETDFFQRQNDHLKSKGLPFFTKMERSLGNQVYLWTQSTFDNSMFLTNFQLSHADPENEHHIVVKKKDKFTVVSDERCKLQIQVKADRHRSKGIKTIALTFTESEENRMIVDGYEKLEPGLSAFELPETSLWTLKTEKKKTTAVTNVDALIAEVVKVRALLNKTPNDKNLQALVARLNDKLEEAYKKELQQEVTNPLQSAVELMALTEEELQKFMRVFEKMDANKSGKLTMTEIFEYFEETPTKIAKEIFYTLDALDENDEIEFGDFLRAVGTYCFFGQEEILRFIYVYADKERVGFLTADQFNALINIISPYEKLRAKRALKSLKLTDDSQITFEDFKTMNGQYPALFLPAFMLQHSLRQKTMGDNWWFHKLSAYRGVRDKMSKEGSNTDDLVELELARFKEDEERFKRMAMREALIKQETSEIKKVIMQARQVMDEFS